MRLFLLTGVAALALAACNQSAPGDATATGAPSAPATMATTNATVEPVPGSTTPATSTPTPTASDTAMPKSPTAAPSDTTACGVGKAARFVGKTATPDVRAQVIEAVGHNRIRWIGPGDAVTMDFSEARLNADLDANNRITGFRCG